MPGSSITIVPPQGTSMLRARPRPTRTACFPHETIAEVAVMRLPSITIGHAAPGDVIVPELETSDSDSAAAGLSTAVALAVVSSVDLPAARR
jgi:hypothetical protein